MDLVSAFFLAVILLTASYSVCAQSVADIVAIASSTKYSPPALMLARSYRKGMAVNGYLISEKFDGVRAYWNGHEFLTRSGRVVNTPEWFTAEMPDQKLDGELWSGRSQFSWLSGVIRRSQPDDSDWRNIRYVVFDLPASDAPFYKRFQQMKSLLEKRDHSVLMLAEQTPAESEEQLQIRLQQVTEAGGEGLMLKRADSLYQAGRSDDLLKVKICEDDEATVIGYVPGEGKYLGLTGALLVRMDDGREFRIGSGLSDAERTAPPLLGSRITFAYNGLTSGGLPRFARFLRIRPEE